MLPRPPDALVDEAIRCPCTAGNRPWCARCECLVQLALARDVWLWEHVTGKMWRQYVAETLAREVRLMRQRGWWSGLGNTLLGWLVEASMWLYYFGCVFPRWTWLRLTGQIPRLPSPRRTRLPVRLRERAWCVVCERILEAGAVRCPVHPDAEVMLVLRDEGDTHAST